MKTVQFRIKAEQARKIQEIADCIPGGSTNAIAQRAVDLWLELEAPVYEAAMREARSKLKRQDVSPIH